jgi:SAM-dependent methyltransferase
MSDSIRGHYQAEGVAGFYRGHGAAYRNPHEPAVAEALRLAVQRWGPDLSAVLDLACGSGEATLVLRSLGAGRIEGADPYTGAAYAQRTGLIAEPWSFADIEAGALAGRRWSLIVCSYALHLAEESRLPGLAWRLAEAADALLVITPHKRPVLRPEWGWEPLGELLADRTRARMHRAVAPG